VLYEEEPETFELAPPYPDDLTWVKRLFFLFGGTCDEDELSLLGFEPVVCVVLLVELRTSLDLFMAGRTLGAGSLGAGRYLLLVDVSWRRSLVGLTF